MHASNYCAPAHQLKRCKNRCATIVRPLALLQVDAHNGQTVVSSAVAHNVRRHAAAAARHSHHQQRLSLETAAETAVAAAAAAVVDAPPLKITLATTVLPSGNEVRIVQTAFILYLLVYSSFE
jgi:hypothetical protein